jgi:hypothetical protein
VLSVVAALTSGSLVCSWAWRRRALPVGRRRDGITLAVEWHGSDGRCRGGRSVMVGPIIRRRARPGGLDRLSGGSGLCWRRRVVRWGALLSAALVVAAYLLPTQVGTTATRLPELFGAPVIMAVSAVPLVVVIASTVATVLLLPPVSISEVQERGDPALSAQFYAPLLAQLTTRGVAGPIEVVATQRRGEAAFVPRWFQLHEAGPGRSTSVAIRSSTTGRSTRTRTENGWTTTPSPTWPCPPARTTGQQLMK